MKMRRGAGRTRAILGSAVVALAISATTSSTALGASSAERATACPGTFQVLHDDRIGKLSIPKGPYVISVKRMTCQDAADDFKRFLQIPEGNLPDNWRLLAQRKKFINRTQNVAFLIKRAS